MSNTKSQVMKFKLSIKTRYILFIVFIPSVILLLSAFILREKLIITNADQASVILKKQLARQAYYNQSLFKECFSLAENISIIINELDTCSLNNIRIIDGVLINNLKANNNISSIWIDWELNNIKQNWIKPFGIERTIAYRNQNNYVLENNILDTIEENINSVHYKCKVFSESYFSPPQLSETDKNIYKSIYIQPLVVNGTFIGSLGIEMKTAYQNLFLKEETNINPGIISIDGKILVNNNKDLCGKDIQFIFSEKTIEKNKLRNIIRNESSATFTDIDSKSKKKNIYFLLPVTIIENTPDWIYMGALPFQYINDLSKKQFLYFIFSAIIIVLLLTYVAFYLSNKYAHSVNSTKDVLKKLSFGDIRTEYKLSVDNNDETGEMANIINSLIDGLNKTANVAREIGNGNLEIEFEKLSDNDIIGDSLREMKESLQKAKIEENKRRAEDDKLTWISQGQAKFGDILRENTSNIEEFTYSIISNLVKYLKVNIGAIYLINDNPDNGERSLELLACYAYERKKYNYKKIAIGEGLVGRCAIEKGTIYLTDIPDDYISIMSGLGGDKPRSLLLVPLLLNEDVYGVIELASFKSIEPYEISFAEKICQNIAATISNVKINIQTSRLLEESKHQAEELASQEEEMRQNLEELQATQEESARREAELSSTFSALNSSLLVGEFDPDGKIISMNNEFINILELRKKEAIGLNYRELLINFGVSESEMNVIWNSINKKEIVKKTLPLLVNEKKIWLNQTYAPILDKDGKTHKILNIGNDITEIKLKEIEVEQLLEESQRKNQELEKAQQAVEYERFLFNTLLENVPQRVFFKSRESKFIRASRSLLKKIGKESFDEVIGKSDYDFLKKEFADKTFNDEQNIMEKREGLINFEEYEKKPDGEEIWKIVSKIPMINEKDECIGLFGIVNEITELKKLERETVEKSEMLEQQKEEMQQNIEELQTTQEELQRNMEENKKIQSKLLLDKILLDTIMIHLPEQLYFKDVNGRYIRISKSMLSLFAEKDVKDIIGKSEFELLSQETAKNHYAEEQEIVETGNPIIDKVFEQKDIKGNVQWISVTKLPIFDQNEKCIGIFGINRDITGYKKLELQLLKPKK